MIGDGEANTIKVKECDRSKRKRETRSSPSVRIPHTNRRLRDGGGRGSCALPDRRCGARVEGRVMPPSNAMKMKDE